MCLSQNSDFLFGFQATMTNPNGDPDQENKPRMDYETATLLVSDARRKRDCRDFLKKKEFPIFVDTLADKKVPMEEMLNNVIEKRLNDNEYIKKILDNSKELEEIWLLGEDSNNYNEKYLELKKLLKKKKSELNKDEKKNRELLTHFNNLFLTEIIKSELIDIRLFGSAMAVEGFSRTYTGPVQVTWGYSLHPVELVKSNTITTIMNDDSSTFGKKHKVYYALVAHYGTMNKYSAKLTGMTEADRDLFRKSLVQGLMSNQTDSKQGQDPLFYLEVIYKPEFDGYLGDLRRFLDVTYCEEQPIRKLEDLKVDFQRLTKAIAELKNAGYIEKVMGWKHPFANEDHLINMPEFEEIDLWAPLQVEG